MNTAVMPLRGRIALGAALLALLAGGLALPHNAHAAFTDNTVCKGTVAAGEKSVDFENPLKYSISCSNFITSYAISFPGREIDAIETEVFGHTPAGEVIGTDFFACNGDLPGWGINCVGTYSGNFNVLAGNVNLSSGNICSPVPLAPVVTVTYATYNQNADGSPILSSSGKPTVTTATAGPFQLKNETSCPKPKKAKKRSSKKH